MNSKNEDQKKLSLIGQLPQKVVDKINGYLQQNKSDRDNVVLTCRLFYQTQYERLKTNLVQYIIVGNQNRAQNILKKYPHLLLERITIKDKSGRIFDNITVWEYTLWALDVRYMAPMMLQCLQGSREGERILKELTAQFHAIRQQPISYQREGKRYFDPHYDFSIIECLEYFYANYPLWSWEERHAQWGKIVGAAQLCLPAHVAQHYCDPDVPFFPVPAFTAPTFKRMLLFFNTNTEIYQNWWGNDSGECLGENLAVYRKCSPKAEGITFSAGLVRKLALNNIQALKSLKNQRIKDLDLLEVQLNNLNLNPREPELASFSK